MALRNPGPDVVTRIGRPRRPLTALTTTAEDSRLLFADDVVAQLLITAQGGKREAVEKAASYFGHAVAAFARFAHFAIESYLTQHKEALKRESEE